jgi:hypothetical protein
MADSPICPPLPGAAIDFNALHDAAKAGTLTAETLSNHVIHQGVLMEMDGEPQAVAHLVPVDGSAAPEPAKAKSTAA